MRNKFREHMNFNDRQMDDIWNTATFIFDANILNNLYRYTKETREELLNAITALSERVWIPYQAAHEFFKNRNDVIFETVHRYSALEELASNLIKEIRTKLRIDSDDIELHRLESSIKSVIATKRDRDLLVMDPRNDDILEKLLTLIGDKVGDKFCEEELIKIYAEGEKRYEKNIPPGYKDVAKRKRGDHSEYGDLIIWHEIMKFSKDQQKNVIYITNDGKEDWWTIIHGQKLGPRQELIKEFHEETKMEFLMYSMEGFTKRFTSVSGQMISSQAVDEILSSSFDSLFSEMGIINVKKHAQAIESIKIRKKKLEVMTTQYAINPSRALEKRISKAKDALEQKERDLNDRITSDNAEYSMIYS